MDQLIERLATITEQLVSFPTIEHNATEIDTCLNWVKSHILAHSPRLNVQEFMSQGKRSLLFTAGLEPPTVLFCGHLDVVDAPRQSDFQTTRIDATRLRGRGTADMKGPIAAMIDIMTHDPVSDTGLLLTTDEEIGGENGVGYILPLLPWKPDVVILPDGGANMRLITEQKGILRLRLIAHGQSAHSSRPWLGDNAILKLTNAYSALMRKYPAPIAEDDWKVSMTLSEIIGGISPNSVPWIAEGTLDVRFPAMSDEDDARLLANLKQNLKRRHIETSVVSSAPGFKLDSNSPFIKQLQSIAASILQRPFDLAREAGASDARYFAEYGIPVLMFQPFCAGWHSDNEWIDLASLAQFRSICHAFAKEQAEHGQLSNDKLEHVTGNKVYASSMSLHQISAR